MNQMSVLDKGHISLYSSSMGEKQVRELIKTLYRSPSREDFKRLSRHVQVHVLIKSPIFVQITFGEQSITIENAKGIRENVQSYTPGPNDVRAKDLKTSELISDDIKQTTEALLLNPKAYQMDACDIFISQVITPISVYNTYLASASLSQWIEYIHRKHLPSPIEEYRKAIELMLKAEWPIFRDLFDEEKQKSKR